mmetsp:Transcript_5205/g.14708  ORF Transcript_5205/g.14708 Transcript_5205/m.14708 type:complete len:202 (-) Transcript_5205:469-1074(-)
MDIITWLRCMIWKPSPFRSNIPKILPSAPVTVMLTSLLPSTLHRGPMHAMGAPATDTSWTSRRREPPSGCKSPPSSRTTSRRITGSPLALTTLKGLSCLVGERSHAMSTDSLSSLGTDMADGIWSWFWCWFMFMIRGSLAKDRESSLWLWEEVVKDFGRDLLDGLSGNNAQQRTTNTPGKQTTISTMIRAQYPMLPLTWTP